MRSLRLLGLFPVGALLLLLPNGVQSLALGLHSNMAVMLEHLARDVAGDVHDRLIARAAFGEFSDEGVA